MIDYYIKIPNEEDFKTRIGLEYNGVRRQGILIYNIHIFDILPDEAMVIKESHPRYPHESYLDIKTVGDIRKVLKEQMEELKKYEYGSKTKTKSKDSTRL